MKVFWPFFPFVVVCNNVKGFHFAGGPLEGLIGDEEGSTLDPAWRRQDKHFFVLSNSGKDT